MARFTYENPNPEHRVYWPDDLETGKLYYTAQGAYAYTVTKSTVALFGDPGANVLSTSGAKASPGVMDRFPFTLFPVGASILITQGASEVA